MLDLSNQNKALMRRVYEEMWNRANPALAAELFAQPVGVERFVRQFLLSFPDLHHTVEEMLTEGDRVVVRFSAHGTQSGAWIHFAATGKPVHYTSVTWARIDQGRIIEHHTWWDKAGLMEQIGG